MDGFAVVAEFEKQNFKYILMMQDFTEAEKMGYGGNAAKPIVSRSADNHEQWLKRFNKSKQGKLFNLLYDVRGYESDLRHYDKLSHLAQALAIACKGTKMEEDAKSLIEIICPAYYSDE